MCHSWSCVFENVSDQILPLNVHSVHLGSPSSFRTNATAGTQSAFKVKTELKLCFIYCEDNSRNYYESFYITRGAVEPEISLYFCCLKLKQSSFLCLHFPVLKSPYRSLSHSISLTVSRHKWLVAHKTSTTTLSHCTFFNKHLEIKQKKNLLQHFI